jgi:hypothetical protein
MRMIKFRRMRWSGHVLGQRGLQIVFLVEKHKGKKPLGKPRCRWNDTIRMDLK